ncbi:MAG: hypothetical protein IKR48_00650, partial [Kiritimatiellae bacterium]|nr:hypothetical protein [Kiritimatiellia bacterium]
LSLHNRTRRSASLPSVTATSGCLLLSLSASPLLSWAASPPYEVIGKSPPISINTRQSYSLNSCLYIGRKIQ